MGALFDWATGAPYYPGSSVKGVLRSLFKVASGDSAESDGCRDELLERIKKAAPGVFTNFTKEDAAYLKCILFGKDQEDNLDIPYHDTCIFYDAYVVGFRKKASGQQVKILGMDSLAPHEDRLKNPIPINMLRIMPDVCLTFNMVLHDVPGKDGNVMMTSDQLLALFKGIILDLGVGAKTHTGYGIVKEIEEPDILFTIPHIKNDQSETDKALDRQDKEMPGAQQGKSHVIPDAAPVPRRHSDNIQEQQPDVIMPVGSISCPKCGAEIIETPDGFIMCKGRCGMVYGRAFKENLSFEETKQLLLGHKVRTHKGRVLSVDLSDSYEAFTTAAGQTKYRLKFRKPE
jgi:CRISPR type III-B/RAMP module RAMP protein Cmr6